MLNIPESIKTLFKSDSVFKNFRVHFPNGEHSDLTNENIISESVSFTESICSKDVFQFGLSERSQIEFECVNMPNIYGVTIECGIEIDTSSLSASDIANIQSGTYDGTLVLEADSDIGFGYYHIPYGVFVVQSCPRSHGAMYRRRVTAYGITYDETLQINDVFNRVLPYTQLTVDTSFFDFLLDHSLYTKTPINMPAKHTGTNTYQYEMYFYNANRDQILVRVYCDYYQYMNMPFGDVMEIIADTDFAQYEQNGINIAKCLDANGIDIAYDSAGNKAYESNEAVLRAKFPHLFYPSLTMTFPGKISNVEVLPQAYVPIELTSPFVATPFNNGQTKAINGTGFFVDRSATNGYFDEVTLHFRAIDNPTGRIVVENVASGSTIADLQYTPINYEYTVTSASYYQADASQLAGTFVTLNSSLSTSVLLGRVIGRYDPDRVYPDRKVDFGVYQNALSPRAAIGAFLEVKAKFGTIDRFGNRTEFTLSKSNPVSITESEISEMWWDEYDVEQIGTAVYKIADTNNEGSYYIGAGGSSYDFGDNYLVKRLFNTENPELSISNVNDTIEKYFVPNISDLPFVPVESTIIGLPYLEAGDYLVIQADQNTQVGTYILTRTLTGIQTLFDEIVSKGGEVLGDGN